VSDETRRFGLARDLLQVGLRRGLVGHTAPVERGDGALVLDPHAQSPQLGRLAVECKAANPVLVASELRNGLGPARARLEQLGAMRAGVSDPADAHEPPRLGGRAAGDAGDAAVAARQPPEQQRDLRAHVSVHGAPDDRGERPVDVAEHGRPSGIGGQRAQGIGECLGRRRGHAP
jgi:hypothetical protein